MNYFKKYAPIIITVYDRDHHFNKCIFHLSLCVEAKYSDLHVFVDFPKTENARKSQKKIFKVLKEFREYFNKIFIVRRKLNYGAKKNTLNAIDQLFKKYLIVIFLEDDCLVDKSFLYFMNQNLILFQKDDNIRGISAYQFPIQEKNYSKKIKIVKLPYCSAWGMGLWKSKYIRPEINWEGQVSLLKNKNLIRKLNEVSFRHHYNILKNIFQKKDKWGDFCFMINLIENDYKWVFPTKTLVKNIGADGTGVNQGFFNKKILAKQVLSEHENIFIDFSKDFYDSTIYKKKIKKYFSKSIKAKLIYPLLKTWFKFKYDIKK